MKYTCQYATQAERQSILDNNQDKFLIEEQNITEGNFLIFADEPSIPIEERLRNIADAVDILLLKQEGII